VWVSPPYGVSVMSLICLSVRLSVCLSVCLTECDGSVLVSHVAVCLCHYRLT